MNIRHYQTIIVFLIAFSINVKGQNVGIGFEQKTLDFFVDSVLPKDNTFKEKSILFYGWVDSTITYFDRDFVSRYPADSLLNREFQRMQNADKSFWLRHKRPTFTLTSRKPIKTKFHRFLNSKNKFMILQIYQYNMIGDKVYVLIKVFTGRTEKAFILYFILNENGQVLEWKNEGTIIF